MLVAGGVGLQLSLLVFVFASGIRAFRAGEFTGGRVFATSAALCLPAVAALYVVLVAGEAIGLAKPPFSIDAIVFLASVNAESIGPGFARELSANLITGGLAYAGLVVLTMTAVQLPQRRRALRGALSVSPWLPALGLLAVLGLVRTGLFTDRVQAYRAVEPQQRDAADAALRSALTPPPRFTWQERCFAPGSGCYRSTEPILPAGRAEVAELLASFGLEHITLASDCGRPPRPLLDCRAAGEVGRYRVLAFVTSGRSRSAALNGTRVTIDAELVRK